MDRIERERRQGWELRRLTEKEWVVAAESHKRNCKVKLSERAPLVQGHLADFLFFFFFQAGHFGVHVRSLSAPGAEALPDISSLPKMNSITSATVRRSRNCSHCTWPSFPLHHVTSPHPPRDVCLLLPVHYGLSKRQLLHFLTLPLGGTQRPVQHSRPFSTWVYPIKAVLK